MSTISSAAIAAVPKLNGRNYHDWKFAIMMLLRRAGAWQVVSGNLAKPPAADASADTWSKLSDEGLSLIGLSIETSQYGFIRTCKSGPEAWKALKDRYEKNSRANRFVLKRQFYNFVHDGNAPIQEYITGITDLATQLKAIGIELSDTDVTDVLIFSLAETWSNIAGTLTASRDELSVEDVANALRDEEARRKKGSDDPVASDSALVSRGCNGRDVPPHQRDLDLQWERTDTSDTRPRCTNCGRLGHGEKHCFSRRTDRSHYIAQLSDDLSDDRFFSHDLYDSGSVSNKSKNVAL